MTFLGHRLWFCTSYIVIVRIGAIWVWLHRNWFDLVHRTRFDFWVLDCDLVSGTEGLRTRFNRGYHVPSNHRHAYSENRPQIRSLASLLVASLLPPYPNLTPGALLVLYSLQRYPSALDLCCHPTTPTSAWKILYLIWRWYRGPCCRKLDDGTRCDLESAAIFLELIQKEYWWRSRVQR